MHPKIKKILPQIEYWLSCKEVAEFKIGFTCDIDRRDAEHKGNGYDKLYPIAFSTNVQIVRQTETDLICYFKACQELANKCNNNVAQAGTGDNCKNQNQLYYLYIVVKFNRENITEAADTHVESLFFNDIQLIQL